MVGEESIFDFSDVPLAFDESAFESLDVTFARENHRPRVPDQAEDSRSSIHLLLRNKCFETSLSVWSIANLEVDSSELSNNRLDTGKGLQCYFSYDLQSSLLCHQGDSIVMSPIA